MTEEDDNRSDRELRFGAEGTGIDSKPLDLFQGIFSVNAVRVDGSGRGGAVRDVEIDLTVMRDDGSARGGEVRDMDTFVASSGYTATATSTEARSTGGVEGLMV